MRWWARAEAAWPTLRDFQAIQIAAIVAMRHSESAVESMAAEYQMRRDVLVTGLHRLGWEVLLKDPSPDQNGATG